MDLHLSAEQAAVRSPPRRRWPSSSPAKPPSARPTTPSRSRRVRLHRRVPGKYLRDARVATLYEGTSQIQQLLIGRALTGVNAF